MSWIERFGFGMTLSSRCEMFDERPLLSAWNVAPGATASDDDAFELGRRVARDREVQRGLFSELEKHVVLLDLDVVLARRLHIVRTADAQTLREVAAPAHRRRTVRDVFDGTCRISTVAPATGWPAASTMRPVNEEEVFCAYAVDIAKTEPMTTTAAIADAADSSCPNSP